MRNLANKFGINPDLIDESNPVFILLSSAIDRFFDGRNVDNKIFLTNIRDMSDPDFRLNVSHELTHAMFGLTPIAEHTEGLAMLLSSIRHPNLANPYYYRESRLLPALGERLRKTPLSAEECVNALQDEIKYIEGFEPIRFNYAYGFSFAMSFFEYFETEGSEYAFEKYLEFYAALKRNTLCSTTKQDPMNSQLGATLIQNGQRADNATDSEITYEALRIAGVDPDKFSESLKDVMRSTDFIEKQRAVIQSLSQSFGLV